MTNREQIAWAIAYSEYEDHEVADQICQMISEVGGVGYDLIKPITKWLGLKCDSDNNWGTLDPEERADYWEEE